MAIAMKTAYGCDGVTAWQGNEPAGNQTVWHYHLHLIPRFADDGYLRNLGDLEHTYRLMPPEQRTTYARKLSAEVNSS
jgi:histidine triad (HIT) family protein